MKTYAVTIEARIIKTLEVRAKSERAAFLKEADAVLKGIEKQ